MPHYMHDYGMLFLNYLPYQSLTYKILQLSEPQLAVNRYEWENDIDFIVNPTEEYYRSFSSNHGPRNGREDFSTQQYFERV